MRKKIAQATEPMRHEGHAKPSTRREFLSQGMIQASSYFFLPSVLASVLGPRAAQAACATAASPSGLLPLVILDMSGGAGLHGNFIVGKEGGALDYLSSYSTMGVEFLPQNTAGSVDRTFGAPMWTTVSNIRKGMRDNMSTAAIDRTSIMTVCHTATDDSKGNRLSPQLLASKAGLVGSVLRTGVAFGGRSPSPIIDASLAAFQMRSPTSLRDLFGYGSISSLESDNSKKGLAAALRRLNQVQSPLLQSLTTAPALSNAFECAHLAQDGLVGRLAALDARLDPVVQEVYGITATATDANALRAAVVYHALKGHTGPGVIEIAGCDYHDATRTRGNLKDEEIGRELGRILELARRLGTGVVVVGITDGSVYSKPAGANAATSPAVRDPVTNALAWVGDAGTKGLSFLACYKPSGRPAMVRTQIGHFLDNSNPGADRESFFGSNPAMVANILFANYLTLSGRPDLFDVAVAAAAFPRSEMSNILAFG
jgi:hypothetical protein